MRRLIGDLHEIWSEQIQYREYLGTLDISTCGRFGDWEYFNMDDSILAGKREADGALT